MFGLALVKIIGGLAFLAKIFAFGKVFSPFKKVVTFSDDYDSDYKKGYSEKDSIGYSTDEVHLFIMNEPDREHLAGITSLYHQGSDFNNKDKHGWTALHFAAQRQSIAAAQALIKFGAVVDAQDKDGNTPLYRAVFTSQGDCAVIRLLLASGAKPDFKNQDGESPEMLARKISKPYIEELFYSQPVTTS